MTKQHRWIKSIIETATQETALPWQRGARRRLSIIRRRAQRDLTKSA